MGNENNSFISMYFFGIKTTHACGSMAWHIGKNASLKKDCITLVILYANWESIAAENAKIVLTTL